MLSASRSISWSWRLCPAGIQGYDQRLEPETMCLTKIGMAQAALDVTWCLAL